MRQVLPLLLLAVGGCAAQRRPQAGAMACLAPVPPSASISMSIAAAPLAAPPRANGGLLIVYVRWANDSIARVQAPVGASLALRSGQRAVSSQLLSSEPHSGVTLGPAPIVAPAGSYHLVIQRADAAPLEYPVAVRAGYGDTVRAAIQYVRNLCPSP